MKKVIIRICLLIIIALTAWGIAIAFKAEPKTIGELMESYENPGMNVKIGSPFSGAVLVAKNGKIIFEEAYGKYNRETQTPNTIDAKYGIGSVTKQFTAMLVMQLVEKNKIKLGDTIGKYLPYLSKEKADHITIHQLLSNTSGLPHYNGLQSIGLNLNEFGNKKYTPKALAQLIGRTRLVNTPGAVYLYSSLGYHLLGVILEEVSGKSYAQLLDESIVKPLGLKNTGFGTNEFIAKNLAKGYRYREEYGLNALIAENGGKTTEARFRDQSTSYSAGGIHSSVKDLYIWSKAIKSYKILSPELTKKMLTPNKDGYCYGWQRNWSELIESNINVRLYGHGGSLSGNSAFIAIYDDETTIIYLSNRSNIKADRVIHRLHLLANNLKDEYELKGYPTRFTYDTFEENGGMFALQDYFNTLSKYCGYVVKPSKNSMRGLMNIHLEEGKRNVADSLKKVFIATHHPEEATLNQFGYEFLSSDHPKFALGFFKECTIKYPFSPNVWDSLGEAYLIYEDYEKSVACHTKAVEIAEKTSHELLKIFKENLKEAQDKLKG